MPVHTSSLAKARAKKARDNALWSAADLLEECLQEVRNGKIKPLHAVVMLWDDEEDKVVRHWWASNVTAIEHTGYLAMALEEMCEKMRS